MQSEIEELTANIEKVAMNLNYMPVVEKQHIYMVLLGSIGHMHVFRRRS